MPLSIKNVHVAFWETHKYFLFESYAMGLHMDVHLKQLAIFVKNLYCLRFETFTEKLLTWHLQIAYALLISLHWSLGLWVSSNALIHKCIFFSIGIISGQSDVHSFHMWMRLTEKCVCGEGFFFFLFSQSPERICTAVSEHLSYQPKIGMFIYSGIDCCCLIHFLSLYCLYLTIQ